MSDENVISGNSLGDPVEGVVLEPVSTDAELTAPPQDSPAVAEPAKDGDEAHALDPDGKRFKQVWARAKAAEAEKDQLKAEVQREREERIRYEERLKAQEQAKVQSEPDYTWKQLQGFIDEGKITLADALEYRERKVAEKARKEAKEEFKNELLTTGKQTTVLSQIERYTALVPELRQPGSAERVKVEREYEYLTTVLGYPPTHATELAATRAALGDVETVERSVAAKRTSTKEPFVETHSSSGKPSPKPADPISKLDERQKAHYTKMIERGRYSGWDEVREELNWVKPRNVGVARG